MTTDQYKDCHERHDEDQREHKDAQRRNTVLGIRDQETQGDQRSIEGERFVTLSDRQVLDFHAAQNDRADMQHESGDHRGQRRSEHRMSFVEDCQYRVQQTHRI